MSFEEDKRLERLAILGAALSVLAGVLAFVLVVMLPGCAIAIGDRASARVDVRSPIEVDAEIKGREEERAGRR